MDCLSVLKVHHKGGSVERAKGCDRLYVTALSQAIRLVVKGIHTYVSYIGERSIAKSVPI